MKVRVIRAVIFVAVLVMLMPAASALGKGEVYDSPNGDWVQHVQEWLKHAAMKSPKWQSQRPAIERYIEDIGYLLQSASLAIRTADYAVAGVELRHAVKMMDRGVARGFYRRNDVEPLKLVITQLVPNIVRYDTDSVRRKGGEHDDGSDELHG